MNSKDEQLKIIAQMRVNIDSIEKAIKKERKNERKEVKSWHINNLLNYASSLKKDLD